MASAAASSNYAAASASSSYPTTTSFYNNSNAPKFTEYRSRVMLGDLPQDFLRIQPVQAQIYDPSVGYGMRQGYPMMQQQQQQQQQIQQNPNFLGYFTLTVAEAKLVKSSGLLGLMKVDPYVSFRIGHVSYDTPIASGGGKNPQWKASYRINLFKGMDRINFEVYDQRNFTEDSFIGECEVVIPREVLDGETRQHWYPLMGRNANANQNQGDILIVMSFMPTRPLTQQSSTNSAATPVVNPTSNGATASASSSRQPTNEHPIPQHSPSAIPKPPPPPYSTEDIQAIQEMFPTVDRHTITELLDQFDGNKDLVVNQLLQNIA